MIHFTTVLWAKTCLLKIIEYWNKCELYIHLRVIRTSKVIIFQQWFKSSGGQSPPSSSEHQAGPHPGPDALPLQGHSILIQTRDNMTPHRTSLRCRRELETLEKTFKEWGRENLPTPMGINFFSLQHHKQNDTEPNNIIQGPACNLLAWFYKINYSNLTSNKPSKCPISHFWH